MENYIEILQVYILTVLCIVVTGVVIFMISEIYNEIFKK
jgi:hypothetical protein